MEESTWNLGIREPVWSRQRQRTSKDRKQSRGQRGQWWGQMDNDYNEVHNGNAFPATYFSIWHHYKMANGQLKPSSRQLRGRFGDCLPLLQAKQSCPYRGLHPSIHLARHQLGHTIFPMKQSVHKSPFQADGPAGVSFWRRQAAVVCCTLVRSLATSIPFPFPVRKWNGETGNNRLSSVNGRRSPVVRFLFRPPGVNDDCFDDLCAGRLRLFPRRSHRECAAAPPSEVVPPSAQINSSNRALALGDSIIQWRSAANKRTACANTALRIADVCLNSDDVHEELTWADDVLERLIN